MDDKNDNDAQGSVIHSSALWNIPDLPFRIICSYLDTSTLMNLRLVCKKFNSYIKNKTPLQEWKKRAKDIWSDAAYPILSPANPDILFWKMSCEALQKQKVLWTRNDYPLINIVKKRYKRKTSNLCHYLSSLLLMHDGTAYILATGCDLFYNKTESEHSDICKKYAHYKPITDLTILNNVIYSCSIDNDYIKSWKLNNGNLQEETSYIFDSADDWPTCLSSYLGHNVLAVGSYSGFVSVFDLRLKNQLLRYKIHEENEYMIDTLAMNSEYIFSADYDNIVYVYDQRAREKIKRTNIQKSVTCMKMQQDYVLIGDHVIKLHVLSPKNDFKVIKNYDIGHTRGIKSVHLTYGSLITSSSDAVIISSPTDPPKHMYTFNIPSVRNMDYQNGTFALFNDSDQLLIYRPVQ